MAERSVRKDQATGKVVLSLAMSLDGFIAGPDVDVRNPMGEGGQRLHDWMFSETTAEDAAILEELMAMSGAVITGRRTYDVGINEWGNTSPFRVPCFVVSHDAPEAVPAGEAPFTFVNDGIESALSQAQEVAGGRNIWVMGGANVAQQYLTAGLLDEIQIHLVPVLLGAGVRLFDHLGPRRIELERISVVESPAVTHLRFRVVK